MPSPESTTAWRYVADGLSVVSETVYHQAAQHLPVRTKSGCFAQGQKLTRWYQFAASALPPKATKLLHRNAPHVASYISGQPKYDADDRIG